EQPAVPAMCACRFVAPWSWYVSAAVCVQGSGHRMPISDMLTGGSFSRGSPQVNSCRRAAVYWGGAGAVVSTDGEEVHVMEDRSGSLAGLIVGAMVGLGLGIMLAPRPRQEPRDELEEQ